MAADDGAAIVVKLDDLLHARRMTLTELAERVGLTLANLSILKTGKARAIRSTASRETFWLMKTLVVRREKPDRRRSRRLGGQNFVADDKIPLGSGFK